MPRLSVSFLILVMGLSFALRTAADKFCPTSMPSELKLIGVKTRNPLAKHSDDCSSEAALRSAFALHGASGVKAKSRPFNVGPAVRETCWRCASHMLRAYWRWERSRRYRYGFR